jgi:4-amino-4-deoxy-L-arabinose transferase-like glycosyltransferase
LRLPFLFEPHWYFDEAIYLTIAQALKRGEILYRDIYDLKPPLIYFTYFLCQSHLFWVRALATGATMLTATILFFFRKSYWTAAIFGLLASMTIFEGGIANTEIFMILPITLAFLSVAQAKKSSVFFISGLLMGLAFLFKIVAFFDLLALILFLIFTSKWSKELTFKLTLQLTGFLFIPFLLSFYFFIDSAFPDLIRSVFLYNTAYVYTQYLILKMFLLCAICCLLFLYRKKIPNLHLLAYLWFSFSLFGALSGGRPYPHYLLQTLPSFSLIIATPFPQIGQGTPFKKFIPAFLVFLLFVFSFFFFNFYRYPIRSYYNNFFLYALGHKTYEEYQKFFNPSLLAIYKTASYLKLNAEDNDSLLVLADYPQIYELSGLKPATRYLSLRHLSLVPAAKEETLITLSKNRPKFVVVFSKQEILFPEAEDFINQNYRQSFSLGGFNVFVANKIN